MLSKLLEKLAEKYPDDKDIPLAMEELGKMEGMEEEMPEDEMPMEEDMDLGMEEEAPMEDGAADLDALLAEDMSEEPSMEDEEEMPMPKKKKKPAL